MTTLTEVGVVLRQGVLASNKLPTYGKPEQRRLHHGRFSWEKKYLMNCHHRREERGAEQRKEIVEHTLTDCRRKPRCPHSSWLELIIVVVVREEKLKLEARDLFEYKISSRNL